MNPLITIVIPTCNRLGKLKRLISDISQYTYLKDIEVKVIANGCTDGTIEYVKSLGGIFSIEERDTPVGFSAAVNIGISMSKGTYIIVIHDDVEFVGQSKDFWIEALLEPMGNEKVAIVAPWFYNMGLPLDTPSFFCVAFKNSIFKKVGLLDDSIGDLSEADFCVRVWEAGYNAVVAEIPVYHIPNKMTQDSGILQKRYGSLGLYYKKFTNFATNILSEYAFNKEHITKCGSGSDCDQITALSVGINKRIISYGTDADILKYISILARKEGFDINLLDKCVLDTDIEPTELLVIDVQNYIQLSSILASHHSNVKHNIIIFGTEKFGITGDDGETGLVVAINDFLDNQKEWYCKEIWSKYIGVTILQRKPENKGISVVIVSDDIEDIKNKLSKIVSREWDVGDIVVVANGIPDLYRDALSRSINLVWFDEKIPFADAKFFGNKAASSDLVLFLE